MIFEYGDGQQAVLHCALDTAGPNRAAVIAPEAASTLIRSGTHPPDSPGTTTAETSSSASMSRSPPRHAVPGVGDGAARCRRRDANDILPPSESVQVMAALDAVRSQIGLSYSSDAR